MLFLTRQLTVTLMPSYQNHKIFCKGNSEYIKQINLNPYLLYIYLYQKSKPECCSGRKSLKNINIIKIKRSESATASQTVASNFN